MTLGNASQPLMAVELALEAGVPGDITDEIRDAVQGYNEDDCRSTEALRDWLEVLRAQALRAGEEILRPAPGSGDPSAAVSQLQEEVETLRKRLLEGLSPDAFEPAHADHARWLLAHLIDWHKREENADWWEYFRLKEMPTDDLFDERDAIAGLTHVERLGPVIGKNGKPTRSVVDRYTYPPQEVEIGGTGKLNARDGKAFGEVVAARSTGACHRHPEGAIAGGPPSVGGVRLRRDLHERAAAVRDPAGDARAARQLRRKRAGAASA